MQSSAAPVITPVLPTAVAAPLPARPGFLKGPLFDGLFLAGGIWLPVLAAIVAFQPEAPDWAFWLLAVFLFDPHLASTWVRLYGDPEERRAHPFLGFALPFAIAAGLTGAALLLPLGWVGLGLYHWQWWHTVRQSYGVLRVYQGRRGASRGPASALGVAALWAAPCAALLFAWQHGTDDYLGFPKPGIELPPAVLWGALALAGLVIAAHLGQLVVARMRGEPLPVPELTLLGGTTLFFLGGAVVLRDLFWDNLLLSLYHSTQYVAFAGLFQERKAAGSGFEGGVLAWVGRPLRFARYALVVVAIGLAYAGLSRLLLPGLVTSAFALVIVEWTVRVHHYMVDARIWRLRKIPVVSELLGVRQS